MIEVVLRLEIDNDRRVSVLFEDRRRAEGRLEAVHLVRPHDAPECAERLAVRLMVVRERLEPPLHLLGGGCGVDDSPLPAGEGRSRRGRAHGRRRRISEPSDAVIGRP